MKFNYNNKEFELILLCNAGSRLYGNSREDSDWDYRGVFIQSIEDTLSLEPNCDTITTNKGDFEFSEYLIKLGIPIELTDDIILYELRKFTSLSIDANPNILDTLFANQHDAPYINGKGKELLNNRHLFLSTKIKFTFSGYAASQLKRMKSHAKMLGRYPNINRLVEAIESSYEYGHIDYRFIQENFGGTIANKLTKETPQENKILDDCITYNDFKQYWWHLSKGLDNTYWRFEFNDYRKPQLIDYINLYDLKHKKIEVVTLSTNDLVDDSNIEKDEFLNNYASFRKFSPSMLALYTEGKGIFSREGNLKANDPEHIGDFMCLCSINHLQYKSDCDNIEKLWNWKSKRNEARSELEKDFGYDTKFLSHLIRLLLKCSSILKDGIYNPVLNSDELEIVNSIKNGLLSYEAVLKLAGELDNTCDDLYKSSILPNKAKFKEINKLIPKFYSY